MRRIIAADLFCGAGGTSSGLYEAAASLGLQVDLLAINHWNIAIATHTANHPSAIHRCESIDGINPREAVPGGRLDLLVASPECMHHSRARGGRPINDQSRASAWHVLRWAEALDIGNILIENVPEFTTWGPLDADGKIIQKKKGKTYLAFINALKSLGYTVKARVLVCADYGDPTTRKRLFILARKGKRVSFPEPTHAQKDHKDMFGERKEWRSAREIIQWDVKGISIFGRKKPLSPNTIKRIEAGLRKYSGLSFLVAVNHGADYTRSYSMEKPFPTVTSVDAWGMVEPFLTMFHGTSYPGGERVRSVDDPMPTVGAGGIQVGLVQPFLVKYYGASDAVSVDEPMDTITGKARFALTEPLAVEIDGQNYLVDILFRMLTPRELSRAQSFPADYEFTGSRENIVKQIGNAVPVKTAAALCRSLLV